MAIFKIISLPLLITALVAAVNILTEVTKRIVAVDKSERVVVAWAEALSIACAVAAAFLQGWTLWWMIVIAVAVGALVGALVAYAAMFGYDDLYRGLLDLLGELVGYLTGAQRAPKEDASDDQQPLT